MAHLLCDSVSAFGSPCCLYTCHSRLPMPTIKLPAGGRVPCVLTGLPGRTRNSGGQIHTPCLHAAKLGENYTFSLLPASCTRLAVSSERAFFSPSSCSLRDGTFLSPTTFSLALFWAVCLPSVVELPHWQGKALCLPHGEAGGPSMGAAAHLASSLSPDVGARLKCLRKMARTGRGGRRREGAWQRGVGVRGASLYVTMLFTALLLLFYLPPLCTPTTAPVTPPCTHCLCAAGGLLFCTTLLTPGLCSCLLHFLFFSLSLS